MEIADAALQYYEMFPVIVRESRQHFQLDSEPNTAESYIDG